jgi:hypothetical protein
MFVRLKGRVVPAVLLIISSLWTAAFIIPLSYSLIFPNPFLREAMQAFEGRPVSRPELAEIGREFNPTFGRLQHAIRLAAYYHGSVEYKAGQLHKTKDVQYTYLVKFEKRPHFAIWAVQVTETDSSPPTLNTWGGSIVGVVQMYLPPVLMLAVSAYWFRRSRTRFPEQSQRVDSAAADEI